MKHLIYALPVALFAAAAGAQTEPTTSTEMGVSGETFGTSWPLSVGTTFFTDSESGTLRPAEELSSGWQSLSQEDRDMITADCTTFLAMHGDADASTDTAASGTGDAATTTATEGAAASATGSTAATDSGDPAAAATSDVAVAGTEGSTETSAAGYDMAEMKAICDAVEAF
jgi:hypothetical protein